MWRKLSFQSRRHSADRDPSPPSLSDTVVHFNVCRQLLCLIVEKESFHPALVGGSLSQEKTESSTSRKTTEQAALTKDTAACLSPGCRRNGFDRA